jgi:hypothetical protein
MLRQPRRPIDVVEANRHGQQLFLADTFRQKRLGRTTPAAVPIPHGRYPLPHRQLVLFEAPRKPAGHAGIGEPPIDELATLLNQAAIDHATRHGWSKTRRVGAQAAIRALLAMQDSPGAAIKASEVADHAPPSSTIQPVLEILTAAGMLDDDRDPPINAWFARQVDALALPEPMNSELRTWFLTLRDGSTTPPRFRPRSHSTIRLRIRTVVPALQMWATTGHRSLREITREQIKAALPSHGSPRALLGTSLRSLFGVLKARKMLFTNPTTRIRTGQPETRQPLPLHLSVLREAMNSTQPHRAAIAALIGFHAPRSAQLRELQLTDIRDGRLHLPDRVVLLASPAQERVAAWLHYRARRWPHTLNPHLFVNTYTAVRLGPVSHFWISHTLGVSPQAVREDRILHEALASKGDVRRLCDLFGLSVRGAERYTDTVNHPDLTEVDLGSRTEAAN